MKRRLAPGYLHMLMALAIIHAPTVFVIGSSVESAQDIYIQERGPQVCPEESPLLLGPLFVREVVDVPDIQPGSHKFEEWYGPNRDNGQTKIQVGGSSSPHGCKSRWPKLAIIVPFRDRELQLKAFLFNLHPILQRQQLNYQIFVVEQSKDEHFNRASLMNIGFLEVNKMNEGFQCFVFHDVDLLPEDDRNLYVCPPDELNQVKHISVSVNKWKYRLQYKNYFGGVAALSKSQVEKINGFSNKFYGWGGEDDNIHERLENANITVYREPANIARFTMLIHGKEEENKDRTKVMEKNKKGEFTNDGLNSLKYELLEVEERLLYTWILAKLPPPTKTEKKKSWMDLAAKSIKHTVDKTFESVAGSIANKVVDVVSNVEEGQKSEPTVY